MFGDLQTVYEGFVFVLGAMLAFLDVIEVEIKMWWAKAWAASSNGLSSDLPGRQQERLAVTNAYSL